MWTQFHLLQMIDSKVLVAITWFFCYHLYTSVDNYIYETKMKQASVRKIRKIPMYGIVIGQGLPESTPVETVG